MPQLIDELVKQVPDQKLREQLEREIAKLKQDKKYGLVFEQHIPEVALLPHLPVKAGSRVVKRGGKTDDPYTVTRITNGKAQLVRESDGAEEICPRDELGVLKRFGEPIYPTLVPVDRVTRAPGKPYHTLINADNFHALQLLLYCYEGMVDVIYIDPPYNTGARDWKYNNDYVDGADQWRHSKWLSMMKKRLLLAKRLLKNDGVLIVTIDEHEVLHLGMLLEELFPEMDSQLATIVSNPGGSFGSNLSNVNEYAYFVVPKGQDLVKGRPFPKEPGMFDGVAENAPVLGRLRKRGSGSLRQDRKNMFYAVYVDKQTLEPKFVGEVIPFGKKPTLKEVQHCIPVYPIDEKGVERRWNYGRETMIDEIEKGNIVAKSVKGLVKLYKKEPVKKLRRMNTVWTASEYAAGDYGSRVVNSIFGRPNAFPFPKSLYAVRDCVGSACSDRKAALILDFFAGSGTTLHATILLNAEDDGNRRCILVTNNEVTYEEEKQANKEGLFQGDPEFEKLGICESVSWPRCKFAINGKRDDGTELPGKYLDGRELKDGFEENLEYFKLDFLDPNAVAYGEQFEAIVPILWLMSGAQGQMEPSHGRGRWFMPKHSPYAVLLKEEYFTEFRHALAERGDITHVLLVTDSEEAYRDMIADLPGKPHTRMLYKSYLDNFRINMEPSL